MMRFPNPYGLDLKAAEIWRRGSMRLVRRLALWVNSAPSVIDGVLMMVVIAIVFLLAMHYGAIADVLAGTGLEYGT